jgi:ABC-type multidrug transport system permease subunit
MRLLFLIFAMLITNAALSQSSLNIYDISRKQLQIMHRYRDADSLTRFDLSGAAIAVAVLFVCVGLPVAIMAGKYYTVENFAGKL